MTRYLEQVTKIAEDTEDADCRMVCRLFKEVCSDIADGAEIDKFTMDMVDNSDHSERHNIAGSMNRPSIMQELGYKK